MPNQYSFKGFEQKEGQPSEPLHMKKAFQYIMEKYDLSGEAIIKFAFAVRDGKLSDLDKLFDELEEKQKEGLLDCTLDYPVIAPEDDKKRIYSLWGTAEAIAEKLGHVNIVDFIRKQKLATSQAANANEITKACEDLDLEKLKDLTINNSNWQKIKNSRGESLIMIAISLKKTTKEIKEFLQYLIDQGVDIEAQAYDKRNALIDAGIQGNLELMQFLVNQLKSPEQRKRFVAHKDEGDKTALDYYEDQTRNKLVASDLIQAEKGVNYLATLKESQKKGSNPVIIFKDLLQTYLKNENQEPHALGAQLQQTHSPFCRQLIKKITDAEPGERKFEQDEKAAPAAAQQAAAREPEKPADYTVEELIKAINDYAGFKQDKEMHPDLKQLLTAFFSVYRNYFVRLDKDLQQQLKLKDDELDVLEVQPLFQSDIRNLDLDNMQTKEVAEKAFVKTYSLQTEGDKILILKRILATIAYDRLTYEEKFEMQIQMEKKEQKQQVVFHPFKSFLNKDVLIPFLIKHFSTFPQEYKDYIFDFLLNSLIQVENKWQKAKTMELLLCCFLHLSAAQQAKMIAAVKQKSSFYIFDDRLVPFLVECFSRLPEEDKANFFLKEIDFNFSGKGLSGAQIAAFAKCVDCLNDENKARVFQRLASKSDDSYSGEVQVLEAARAYFPVSIKSKAFDALNLNLLVYRESKNMLSEKVKADFFDDLSKERLQITENMVLSYFAANLGKYINADQKQKLYPLIESAAGSTEEVVFYIEFFGRVVNELTEEQRKSFLDRCILCSQHPDSIFFKNALAQLCRNFASLSDENKKSLIENIINLLNKVDWNSSWNRISIISDIIAMDFSRWPVVDRQKIFDIYFKHEKGQYLLGHYVFQLLTAAQQNKILTNLLEKFKEDKVSSEPYALIKCIPQARVEEHGAIIDALLPRLKAFDPSKRKLFENPVEKPILNCLLSSIERFSPEQRAKILEVAFPKYLSENDSEINSAISKLNPQEQCGFFKSVCVKLQELDRGCLSYKDKVLEILQSIANRAQYPERVSMLLHLGQIARRSSIPLDLSLQHFVFDLHDANMSEREKYLEQANLVRKAEVAERRIH